MTAVRLPAVLDIRAAVQDDVRPAQGQQIIPERPGGLCLQVLISAKKTWDADGKGFNLNPASTALNEQLAAYGCADLNTDPVGATR